MKLILADFDGVFGLKGKINFIPKAPVILYAPNISGKTNVITTIRMCFLGHKIFRELNKEEAILKPLKEGSATCYFSQWDRIFRLSYVFKRFGESVRRSCRLSSIPSTRLEGSADDIHRFLEAQSWKEEATTPKDIKKRLEEVEVYPEIMDILLASSNIDGYLRAVEGEVCEIPEALSKQLTDVKNEAVLNVKRIEKFKGEIEVLEETQKACMNQQKQLLKKIGVKPVKIKSLFMGKVAEKLDAYGNQINQRLARGIPEDTQKAILANNSLKPQRNRLETIETARKSIKKSKEFKSLLKKVTRFRNAKEQWSQISEVLKSVPQDVWSLDAYAVPHVKKSFLTMFKDSSDIEELLKQIRQNCTKIKKAKEKASKHEIDSLSYLERTVEELNTALSRLKNPQELPEETVPALICMLPKQRLPTVSIPIDRYESKLAKVSSVTTIHIPEDISSSEKRKFDLRIKEIEHNVTELKKSLAVFEQVEMELEKINDLVKTLCRTKEKELTEIIESLEGKLSEIQRDWNGASTVLYNSFNLGKMSLKFIEESYEKDLTELQKNLTQCQKKFEQDIEETLSLFPRLRSKLLKKLETKNFDSIAQELSRRVAKLEKERELLTKLQKWLQKEAEAIKKAYHDLQCSRVLLKKVIPFAQVFYSLVSRLINLEEVVESLGEEMEHHVETAYSSIFAEPTFKFTHIGKGLFVPTLDDQPISFRGPSGSQSAAVSFGVLYTLADQYKLPLIMDEAADRFDPTRLANFLELIKTTTIGTTEEDAKQVCLAIYETKNVSPETLNSFNTYECMRISNIEKKIQPYTVKT
jgi:DNA repair exonuclease SbcCD ATPase subunit